MVGGSHGKSNAGFLGGQGERAPRRLGAQHSSNAWVIIKSQQVAFHVSLRDLSRTITRERIRGGTVLPSS